MGTSKDFEPPVFKDLTSAVRALAMDAVQKANSGHPGAPMGMLRLPKYYGFTIYAITLLILIGQTEIVSFYLMGMALC